MDTPNLPRKHHIAAPVILKHRAAGMRDCIPDWRRLHYRRLRMRGSAGWTTAQLPADSSLEVNRPFRATEAGGGADYIPKSIRIVEEKLGAVTHTYEFKSPQGGAAGERLDPGVAAEPHPEGLWLEPQKPASRATHRATP